MAGGEQARLNKLTKRVRKIRSRYSRAVEQLREIAPIDYLAERKQQRKVENVMVGTEIAKGPSHLILSGDDFLQENPDLLVDKKGLKIYDEMKKDDMVKAALFVKKFSRLATKWTIRPGTDDKQGEEIAEFYEIQLEQMPGTIMQFLLGMLTCLDYGYAILEKNTYYIKEGRYNGKIGLQDIKSKRPHDFKFKQDEYTNVIALQQQQDDKYVDMPIDKFICTAWMPEWNNPYGVSDLKAAYEGWWSKSVVMKFWNMFLEKYPAPVVMGTFPPGASDTDKEALLEILEDIQVGTVVRKPEGFEIETITMDVTGSDIYDKAIDKRDRMIARSMLIPDLLGLGGSRQTGSYALGRKQFDLFIGMLWHMGRTLEETINEQLTKGFIDMNFTVNEYPEFTFETAMEESGETRAKIINVLAQAGFLNPLDEEHVSFVNRYMNILPGTKTKASEMAREAVSFKEPYKFMNPDGKDAFNVEIQENMARLELMEDALAKG